jgi:hypothetical protein
MYEVFDLNEAYVVRKITIELNKSHEIEANNSNPKEHSAQISMVKNLFGSISIFAIISVNLQFKA